MNKHLNNIENIKNDMIVSLSKDFSSGFNIGKIEDRLIETKNQIRKEAIIDKIDKLDNSNKHIEELGYDSGR